MIVAWDAARNRQLGVHRCHGFRRHVVTGTHEPVAGTMLQLNGCLPNRDDFANRSGVVLHRRSAAPAKEDIGERVLLPVTRALVHIQAHGPRLPWIAVTVSARQDNGAALETHRSALATRDEPRERELTHSVRRSRRELLPAATSARADRVAIADFEVRTRYAPVDSRHEDASYTPNWRR